MVQTAAAVDHQATPIRAIPTDQAVEAPAAEALVPMFQPMAAAVEVRVVVARAFTTQR